MHCLPTRYNCRVDERSCDRLLCLVFEDLRRLSDETEEKVGNGKNLKCKEIKIYIKLSFFDLIRKTVLTSCSKLDVKKL